MKHLPWAAVHCTMTFLIVNDRVVCPFSDEFRVHWNESLSGALYVTLKRFGRSDAACFGYAVECWGLVAGSAIRLVSASAAAASKDSS